MVGGEEKISYRLDTEITQLLRGQVSASDISPDKNTPAEIAWANGKLFLRMKPLLGPFRICVISPVTLKILDIFEIDFPFQAFEEAKNNWKKELAGIRIETDKTEWVLGDTTVLSCCESACILGSSTNTEEVIHSNILAVDNDESFAFADGDKEQSITIDLGRISAISSITVDFERSEPVNRAG